MMEPGDSDLAREQELFQRCLDTDPGDRAALLGRECGENIELRTRIERMLEFHQKPGDNNSFLDRGRKNDPDRIGPYRILQRLGEGGMGIVYAAEQREPVRRRVAIKVLREGYGTREVLARFDMERQALALMNHASIARILDAGTTADHRPFIVMEFVAGEPITRYCERQDLPLEARLILFCEICDAVQHAHQRGVIHRDLKPSNILITEEDGVAIAKVIDFGIAKAIAQRLTDQTLETRIGSLLGTPDYMSPEQAELSPLDVDTRTDVYALGAVLYQLLTGVTPLELAGFSKNFTEMQRLINEQIPVPPSQRVSGPLQRLVRGELDWITMKALEKQRTQRYASTADLARDVRAHLQNETVVAGPPSRFRKLRKLARRHWLATSATISIALILAVSQVVLVQKNRELQFERDRANSEAAIAQRVTSFTASIFQLANPGEIGAPETTARELLDIGVRRLEQEAAGQDSAVQAALFEAAAKAYLGLGLHDKADSYLDKVRQLLEGSDSTVAQRVNFLRVLVLLRANEGDLPAAEEVGNEALALLETDSSIDEGLALDVHTDIAHILRRAGRPDEGAELLQRVLPENIQTALKPNDKQVRALTALGRIHAQAGRLEQAESLLAWLLELNPHKAVSLEMLELKTALADVLVARGESLRALPLLRDAVDISRGIYGGSHWQTGIMYNNLGNALSDLPEHLDEAERTYIEAREIIRAALGDSHLEMATVQNNLAGMYISLERWEEAESASRQAADIRLRAIGDHPFTANTLVATGFVLGKQGKSQEAEGMIRDGLAMFEKTVGESDWRTANARIALGSVLANQQRIDEAIAELVIAKRDLTAALGVDHWRTQRAGQRLSEITDESGDAGLQGEH